MVNIMASNLEHTIVGKTPSYYHIWLGTDYYTVKSLIKIQSATITIKWYKDSPSHSYYSYHIDLIPYYSNQGLFIWNISFRLLTLKPGFIPPAIT